MYRQICFYCIKSLHSIEQIHCILYIFFYSKKNFRNEKKMEKLFFKKNTAIDGLLFHILF